MQVQHGTKTCISNGELGINFNGLRKMLFCQMKAICRFELIEFSIDQTQIIIGPGKFWILPDALAIVFNCFLTAIEILAT